MDTFWTNNVLIATGTVCVTYIQENACATMVSMVTTVPLIADAKVMGTAKQVCIIITLVRGSYTNIRNTQANLYNLCHDKDRIYLIWKYLNTAHLFHYLYLSSNIMGQVKRKIPSNMHKMHRFRSYCARLCLCPPFIHL